MMQIYQYDSSSTFTLSTFTFSGGRMVIRTARSRNFATNSLFPILVMVFFGWGLLHIWGVEYKARWILHLIFALPGIALSGIAFHRYQKHWPGSVKDVSEGIGRGKKLEENCRAIACCLLLAPVGFVLALFAKGGSFFFMALVALGMMSIPWTRMPACRQNFFTSLAGVETGAVLGLAVTSGPAHPFALLSAAWVCLIASTIALVFVGAVHGNRSDRMPPTGYLPDTGLNPEPSTAPGKPDVIAPAVPQA